MGYGYNPSRRRGRIRASGRLLHPQSDRSLGGEKCPSGRRHSSLYNPRTLATCLSFLGQLPRWRDNLDNEFL